MTNKVARDLITTGEAARRLGLSVRAVQYRLDRGELPYTRVGPYRMIDPRHLGRAGRKDGRGWPAGKPRKPKACKG